MILALGEHVERHFLELLRKRLAGGVAQAREVARLERRRRQPGEAAREVLAPPFVGELRLGGDKGLSGIRLRNGETRWAKGVGGLSICPPLIGI